MALYRTPHRLTSLPVKLEHISWNKAQNRCSFLPFLLHCSDVTLDNLSAASLLSQSSFWKASAEQFRGIGIKPHIVDELVLQVADLRREMWHQLMNVPPDLAALLLMKTPSALTSNFSNLTTSKPAESPSRVLQVTLSKNNGLPQSSLPSVDVLKKIFASFLQVTPKTDRTVIFWLHVFFRFIAISPAFLSSPETCRRIHDKFVALQPAVASSASARSWSSCVAAVAWTLKNSDTLNNNSSGSNKRSDVQMRNGVDHFHPYLKFFQTAALKNAMVCVSKHCTTAPAAQWFSRALSGVVSRQAQALFGTPAVRDALIKMAYTIHRARGRNHADAAAHALFSAIFELVTYHPQTRLVFCTPEVRAALILLAPVATSWHVVMWWLRAVRALIGTPYNKITRAPYNPVLVTVDLCQALMQQAPFVTNQECAREFCSLIALIIDKCSRGKNAKLVKVFACREMHDALLQIEPVCDSPTSKLWWLGCLLRVVRRCEGASTSLATPQMYRVIMRSRSALEMSETVMSWWWAVVSSFGYSQTSTNIVCTEEVRDALLETKRFVVCCATARWWCSAMGDAAHTNVHCNKFCTREVFEALMSLKRYALMNELAATFWVRCVSFVAKNADVELLEATFVKPELRDVIVGIRPLITRSWTTVMWLATLSNLTRHSVTARELFCTQKIIDGIVACRSHVDGITGARWFVGTISGLTRCVTDRTREITATPAVRDGLLDMLRFFSAPGEHYRDDLLLWLRCLTNLVGVNDTNVWSVFATKEVRDGLLAVCSDVTTNERINWWVTAVSNICRSKDRSAIVALYASEQRIRDALVVMQRYLLGKDDRFDSVRRWIGAVSNVARHSKKSQLMFCSHAPFRSAMFEVFQKTETLAAKQWWASTILWLTSNNPRAAQYFATDEVCEILITIINDLKCSDYFNLPMFCVLVNQLAETAPSGRFDRVRRLLG